MKKIKVIFLCLLLISSVLMPYKVAFTAGNSINLVFINDVYERNELILDELKNEFGLAPNFLRKIHSNVRTKNDKISFAEYTNYDVIALPLEVIDNNLINQIRELIKTGKTIYLYGKDLNTKTAESIFDIQIPNIRENQNFHVIGMKNDGELQIFLGDYTSEGDVEESFYSDPLRYYSLVISSVEKNILQKNGVTVLKNDAEAATRVKSFLNYTNTYYYSSILRIVSNLDYYIWREADSDPNNDYFALETSYEITPYNDTIYMYKIKHEQYTSNHQIDTWSPASSTSGSWTVSLPWGISWNFNSILSLKNVTSGSQTYDWASWDITRSGGWINSTTRFRPGSSWVVQNPSGYFAVNTRIEIEAYLTGMGGIQYPSYDLLTTYFY